MSTVQPAGILPDIQMPEGFSHFFNVLTDEGFWARFGVIFLGSVLIIIGLVLMLAGAKGVQQAASMAVGVASKGIIK